MVEMRDILFFWAEKEIDGFRCDMVEMVPLAFWQWVIPQVKNKFPDIIFIAEIYNPAVYRDFWETTYLIIYTTKWASMMYCVTLLAAIVLLPTSPLH